MNKLLCSQVALLLKEWSFMNLSEKITMLIGYKTWANDITFSAVSGLPKGEATKQRKTRFGNMVHTLNHVYVIDDIFKCHLLDKPHNYTARNTDTHPPLSHLRELQAEIDKWYMSYVANISEGELSEIVSFEFVGGGQGTMSRADIIIHVVNHGTYHRGFVGDMMYQVPATPPTNDLPVYLREINSNA